MAKLAQTVELKLFSWFQFQMDVFAKQREIQYSHNSIFGFIHLFIIYLKIYRIHIVILLFEFFSVASHVKKSVQNRLSHINPT